MPHLRVDKVTRLMPSETYKLLLNQKWEHPQATSKDGPTRASHKAYTRMNRAEVRERKGGDKHNLVHLSSVPKHKEYKHSPPYKNNLSTVNAVFAKNIKLKNKHKQLKTKTNSPTKTNCIRQQLQWTESVCFRFTVCFDRAGRLQIFFHVGKFVSKFKSHGNQMFQASHPQPSLGTFHHVQTMSYEAPCRKSS